MKIRPAHARRGRAKNLAEMANKRGIETWAKFFNAVVARDIIAQKGRAKTRHGSRCFFSP